MLVFVCLELSLLVCLSTIGYIHVGVCLSGVVSASVLVYQWIYTCWCLSAWSCMLVCLSTSGYIHVGVCLPGVVC